MRVIVPFCRMSPMDFLCESKAIEFIKRISSELKRLNAQVTFFLDAYFEKMFRDFKLDDFPRVHYGGSGFETALPETVLGNPVFLNKPDQDSDLMILSPRNPLLTAKMLKTAIASFEKAKTGMLASVVASSDHPCQLFSLTESQHGNVYMMGKDSQFSESPFVENPDLWIHGEDNSPCINRITRKPILGRQDFPPVFEADGSFIITHSSTLRQSCQSANLPDVYGFVIEGDKSIHICTKFDYLKYRAAAMADRQTVYLAAGEQ